ncbi:MAG: DsbA family protein [Chitinophagaceae bacterium]
MSLHNPVSSADNVQGNAHAHIVLVEYGDYECPHCGAAYPIVKKLQSHFGNKLLFVFRNFPLTEIHPHALAAAYVAESAAAQGKFWPVHDLIFEHQNQLSVKSLLSYATKSGVDIAQLEEDMTSDAVINKVETDIEGGLRSGVNGTPTFFVNGKRYEGDYEYEAFKEFLEAI